MSYVIGRAIWGGTNAHNLGMKGMADDLLSNPKFLGANQMVN